jgi:hypothetical protein
MIRLNLHKEPYWLELPAEVKIKVYPLSTAIMNAAQSMVIKQIKALQAENNLENEQIRLGLSQSLLIKALAIASITEWQGVFLPEGEELAAASEQNICDLMDIWFIGQEFWEKYTTSFFLLETEGNGSRPAVHGTLAAGLDIAKVATKKDSRVAKVKKVS